MKDIGVKINLKQKVKQKVKQEPRKTSPENFVLTKGKEPSRESGIHESNLTSDYQDALVEGLSFKCCIHANKGLSMFNILRNLTILDDEHREKAYDMLRKCPNVSSKARDKLEYDIEKCQQYTGTLSSLRYIIKTYNKEYYDNVLSKFSKNKYIGYDDISEFVDNDY